MSRLLDPYVTPTRLVLDDLTVDYGATRALAHVSARIEAGQIVALLGHNGAGKSTLFNIISGASRPTSGQLAIDGVVLKAGLSPIQAAEMGVTVIHQEPALIPNLSVLDNICLARPRQTSRKDRRSAAETALARTGLAIKLDALVSSLDIAQRQLVELARGIYGGATGLLLLDEPTASLGRAETEALHALIREFAEEGTAVVYVSHRLPDILDVCTRILVLRGGELVLDADSDGFTPAQLADALVPGIEQPEFVAHTVHTGGLSVPEKRIIAGRGEVVGLFGMAAGDQFRMLEQIAGVQKPSLRIVVDDIDMTLRDPADAIRHGVVLIPADRERDGLLSTMTAAENVMLPWFAHGRSRGWWVTSRSGARLYARARRELGIHGPGPKAPIEQFSGGNRQKHLIARWLYPGNPQVVLMAQPTQGVDVGARREIVSVVRTAAESGVVVLVASAESDEITAICDRAYVVVGDRTEEVRRGDDFDARLMGSLLQMAQAARGPKRTEEAA